MIEQIGAIMVACIVSAGGIGGMILAVIRFSSNIIADRLSVKYENKLKQEMERYKVELNKKEYVSKTRFDVEFQIYRELSQAFCTMVKDISILIPIKVSWKYPDQKEQKEYEAECYTNAVASFKKAMEAIYANAAFIPQVFFESYEEILTLCKQQLDAFAFFHNELALELKNEKDSLTEEDHKRTGEINEKWDEHNNKIREYLSSLDVL